MSAAELRASLGALSAADKAAAARDPKLMQQWARTFLVQRLVLEEAVAHQWDRQPEVQALLEQARKTTLVDSYLKSLSQPADQYPSEAEMKQAYEAKKASFFVPKTYLLAQIFVAASKESAPADQERARQKLATLQEALRQPKADFAELAHSQSEDPGSAAQGGEIGWLTESQIQPEIRAKFPELKHHVVSDPISLADGWHIFQVRDVREPHTLTFEQVRESLAQEMRAQATQSRAQAYLTKLLQDHPPQINETSLAKVQGQLRP